jgi:alkylation response protein AidB-like acyl-CoA dehydrogenase
MTVTSDVAAPVVPQEGTPLGFTEIRDAATAMRPWLRERSADIEAARRLPDDVVDALKAAGAFRMNMPRIWGGPELTSMEQIEVIEEYARGDASAAWCVMIGCDGGLYTSWLDDTVGREMYPRLDMVQAGWVYPVGKAIRVDGGYEMSGHWMFGSGCQHADWIGGGCWVFESAQDAAAGAPPVDWRVLLAPAPSYEILDAWYTTGLCGTGSTDYECTKLFVPEARTFSYLEPSRRAGTLYAGNDTFLRKMAGIPLGVARAAIDDAVALLEHKTERPSGQLYREMPRVQSTIAEAEMLLGAARVYVFDSVQRIWDRYDAGEVPTAEERAAGWLSRLNAFQSARRVVRSLYDVIGGSAVYSRQTPFDRYLRDVETMCQHVVGQRKGLELVGSMLLDPSGASVNPFLGPPPAVG